MDSTLVEIIEFERWTRREHPVLYWVVQVVLFVEQPGQWLSAWWGRILVLIRLEAAMRADATRHTGRGN